MNIVQLRSVQLGAGRPKVCVPLVASSIDELRAQVEALILTDFDLVELRIDALVGSARNTTIIRDSVTVVREGLPAEVPILFAFRTAREGGKQRIADEDYVELITSTIDTHQIDAVDLEMMRPRWQLDTVLAAARTNGVAVVMSNHEFHTTPPKDEIIARLRTQQDLGGDVLKIAVMPSSRRDVITLLDAAQEFVSTEARQPVIAISMGAAGVLSRLAAEVVGSSLSFGTAGNSSAPGQIPARELRQILDIIHRGM